MSLLDNIEKDIKANIKDGIALFKERSTAVSKKIGRFTEEGKRKYKIFTLKLKVQDEFTKLGGKIYDISHKYKNPMTNKKVTAIISRIKKIDGQIKKMEKKQVKKKRKATRKSSK